MSKVIPNSNTWIGFSLTAPASSATPTEAELDAATNMTPFIVSLNPTSQGNAVPTPALDSLFDRSVIGTSQGSFTGDFYRDDSADTAWTSLKRGTAGFFFVSRFGGTGTAKIPRNGQGVEVWPVAITARTASNLTSNTVQTFTVTAAVPDPPTEDAVVASSTGAPSNPRNLVATQGATGVVTLDWDVPTSAGGSAITNYKVYKSTTSASTGFTEITTNMAPAHPSTATSVVCSSVATGATWFRVAATNTQGDSAFSNVVALTVT